jgi:hypothetical protein
VKKCSRKEIIMGGSVLELSFSKIKSTKNDLHTPTISKIENACINFSLGDCIWYMKIVLRRDRNVVETLVVP